MRGLVSPISGNISLDLYRPTAGDGCVLYLPGQDDAYSATIRDRSGNNNHGTIVGATWARQPKGLWGISQDNSVDDYVSLTSNITKGLTAVTVLFWLKPSDKSDTHTFLGDYTSTTDVSMACACLDVSATTTWKMNWYTKGEDSAAVSLAGTTTTLSYGKWYLWGATWNGATKILYINGIADGSAARVDACLESTVTLNTTIGAYAPAANKENVYGVMALPLVLNVALSDARVLNYFNQTRHLFGV